MNGIRRVAGVTVIALAAVAGWALSPAATYAAGRPEVIHGQFAYTGADLAVVNICNDLADFAFSTEGSFTSVDMGDGVFHLQVASHSTYTVTFLDTSKGVWEATIRGATSVQATRGGTFTMSWVANSFEGPVRIHERTTFVVGPDGAIRVDDTQFDFVGCPAA